MMQPQLLAKHPKNMMMAILGNLVEWFDFTLFGFLIPVIAQHFFPADGNALLKTLGILAVSFFFRPIGAVIWGRMGDKLGRKTVLVATLSLMMVSTALIGMLPTYEHVGVWATYGLIFLRCLQGFSTAGEGSSLITWVGENSAVGQRAHAMRYLCMCGFLAAACAVGTVLICEYTFGKATFNAWGWRIPFLLAIPLGSIGFYWRIHLAETPAFTHIQQNKKIEQAPLKRVFLYQKTGLIAICFFAGQSGSIFYIFNSYLLLAISEASSFSPTQSLAMMLLAFLLATFLCWLFPLSFDFLSRRTGIKLTVLLVIVLSYPIFFLIHSGLLLWVFFGMILIAIISGLASTLTMLIMSEAFPTSLRNTGSSIGYNMGNAVFGGSAPFISAFLVKLTGYPTIPAIYLCILALMVWFFGGKLPDHSRVDLKHIS